MEIERGMYFRGDVNGKVILIINASTKYVTYKCIESGKVFTVARNTFEHCALKRI